MIVVFLKIFITFYVQLFMENKIKWRTGVPKKGGQYLVTLSSGIVTADIWLEYPKCWYELQKILILLLGVL